LKSNKTLIIIVGATAIGKTNLSIQLAKHYQTEILSVDSRQFYKEMEIGTAKPSSKEMQGIPHHFIDSHSIHNEYTVGKFENDFIKLANSLFETKDVLIAVGGSGLFVKAICDGFDDIPTDLTIRENLNKRYENEGLEKLQNELKDIDPDYYNKTDIQNSHRVIRALEVYQCSGKKISDLQSGAKKKRDFEIIKIGLNLDRELLYKRINLRVDMMLEAGLLKEVADLKDYKHLSSLQTVGYQEFWDYFDGKISLEEAVELVKRNTRRFAKRQLTWFRKDEDINWFEPMQFEKVKEFISKKIN